MQTSKQHLFDILGEYIQYLEPRLQYERNENKSGSVTLILEPLATLES